MKFDIITIFPEILDSYFSKGMIRIAREKKIIKIKAHDLRRFAVDKRGTVDDKPYGGGPGQILMAEPVYKALRFIVEKVKSQKHALSSSRLWRDKVEGLKVKSASKNSKVKKEKIKIILLSAKGKKWNQQTAQRLSKYDQLIFVCPRYEGHDERIKKFVDEEISIGDYVLTGGELGAAVIIDSITRLLPGVLGEPTSLKNESHSTPGYLEYPQYTRPAVFQYTKKQESKKTKKQLVVPQILLSGDHKKIALWRQKQTKTLKH